MTNPELLSSMKLSDWKMFTDTERFEMFKKSESNVNAYNAKLTAADIKIQEEAQDLEKTQVEYENVKRNVKKQKIERQMVQDELKDS